VDVWPLDFTKRALGSGRPEGQLRVDFCPTRTDQWRTGFGHLRTLAPAFTTDIRTSAPPWQRLPHLNNIITAREATSPKQEIQRSGLARASGSKAATQYLLPTDAGCDVSLAEMQGAHRTEAAREGGHNTRGLDNQHHYDEFGH